MSLIGTIVLFRTISRGHDFGERLEPTSADALRDLWNEIRTKCFKLYTRDPNNSLLFDVYESLNANILQCKRELTNDPEQSRMEECHRGIDQMYAQCREASTLGDVEAADQSAWAVREVVFPPTRTTQHSARD
jgi:hypothetical protein